jgi:lipopolysaccharide export system protein LptA
LACLAVAAGTARAAAPPASASALPDCPPERELCVQAERSGGIDLKSGIAYLEGNVVGVMRSRGLTFNGHSLRAFRGENEQWVRVTLDRDVRVRQEAREAAGDHGVLERDTIRLWGHVRIEQETVSIRGERALIESEPGRMTVQGAPMEATVQGRLLEPGEGSVPAAGEKGAGGENGAAGVSRLQAQEALFEEPLRRVVLTGEVRIEQSDPRFVLDAERVILFFAEGTRLDYFRAEGNVRIVQPDRQITADFAQSRNQLQTIQLIGHATLQQKGQFDLSSERMEVYAQAGKGIVQSQDRRKPITLSMDLAGGTPYRLNAARMIALSDQGLPPAVLEKLAPLLNRSFATRAGFIEAVETRLTDPEARRHLDAIVAAAR